MSRLFQEVHVQALFVLAGIEVKKAHRLENKYWPEHEDYNEVRRISPWWLVMTPYGAIEIGWRKRVISIRWEDTDVRKIITEDAVTKEEDLVHAYSYVKALEYLTALSWELHAIARAKAAVTEERSDA